MLEGSQMRASLLAMCCMIVVKCGGTDVYVGHLYHSSLKLCFVISAASDGVYGLRLAQPNGL